MKRLAISISQCNYQLSQGKVDKLSMVGVNGKKFPDIRAHLEKNIAGVYKNFDVSWVIITLYLIRPYLYPSSALKNSQKTDSSTQKLVRVHISLLYDS